MNQEVTLAEMLEAQEARVYRQQALMEQYGLPVVSFSLNIAGPIKTVLFSAGLSGRGFPACPTPSRLNG